jgi:hypothetical protein
MRNFLLLQDEEDADEAGRLLEDELEGAAEFFGLDGLLQGALGQLHDDADFPDGFGKAVFDLDVIAFAELG